MATQAPPSPELFFDVMFAYQRTAALKAAIDLEIFTAIAAGASEVAAIAVRCGGSQRGIRIICDNLAIMGFLTKSGEAYQLTPDSAMFLDRRSPAYLGGAAAFLGSPDLMRNFDRLADTVRNGTVQADANTVSDDNPVWVTFARSMGPTMVPQANAIADVLGVDDAGAVKVLDLAAGHGLFGIVIATRNRAAEVVAVDWAPVLGVASENARAMGVADRHRALSGDALEIDYGTGYDVALVTNFLHHFDRPTCVGFLKKVHAALKNGGKVAVLDFVPNEDRVSPPLAASFSLNMLAGTPGGDAYTFREHQAMLSEAGFSGVSAHPLPALQTIIVATR